MKFLTRRYWLTQLLILAVIFPATIRADDINADFRKQFSELCDLAVNQVTNPDSKGAYFVDSYAVRALCAAYDMTGNTNYLDACRQWSDRMVEYQEKMTPHGAYYMHYNRKPGETTNDWYSADSSSIGMGILATAVRCEGAERKRLLKSTEKFADLVLKNYVKPSGGVSDGQWHKSSDEWWCSSTLFGSFVYNLYAVTGERRYLKAALGITGWLNKWDPNADQPFPLSQQGPAMVFYAMESYSAGWPYIEKDKNVSTGALAKVNWCFEWTAEQQAKAPTDRKWSPTVWWGSKFGGMPFHQYIFSQHLPDGDKLKSAGDIELRKLAAIQFEKPEFTQLTAFLMMSYAERLNPGAIYRSR